MKQPELGQKIAELRQKNNLTQEEIAERCHVKRAEYPENRGGRGRSENAYPPNALKDAQFRFELEWESSR